LSVPTTTSRRRTGWERPARAPGAVLLEVVLALALFVMAAAIVLGGVGRSVDAAIRLQRQARAADLAVTLLSRIQMGQVDPVSDGPNAYADQPNDDWEEELEDWTWQVVATEPAGLDPDAPPLKTVEVIITHVPTGYNYRLAGLRPDDEAEEEALARAPAGRGRQN